MSHVEIQQNINELKAELLNQYGAVIVFLADWVSLCATTKSRSCKR